MREGSAQAAARLQHGFPLWRGAAEGALLTRGTRRRLALEGERVKLAAALV